MNKDYIMAVTNGSACCNVGYFKTGCVFETERLILSSYDEIGPRFFWEACEGRCDLEELLTKCEREHITIYLLDGDQLTKYGEDEEGRFVWKDF